MIMGSIYVTAGAIILGVPIGILTSVFMAKYCPKKIYPVLKGATELWQESRPLYMDFWIGSTCAIDQRHLPEISLGWKWKQHSDCIYLTWNDDSSTIIGVTESAIRSVPAHYYEGALALGATHERSIFSVVLPAAKSGCCSRNCTGDRTCDRRDDGSDHGSRKPGENACGDCERCSYSYGKYCAGDGICSRTSQRGTDCNCRCFICLYPADQSFRIIVEQEGTT